MTPAIRTAWHEAQRRDPSLAGPLKRPEKPFGLGSDGVLEKEETLKTGQVVQVPVVPSGIAGPGQTA